MLVTLNTIDSQHTNNQMNYVGGLLHISDYCIMTLKNRLIFFSIENSFEESILYINVYIHIIFTTVSYLKVKPFPFKIRHLFKTDNYF